MANSLMNPLRESETNQESSVLSGPCTVRLCLKTNDTGGPKKQLPSLCEALYSTYKTVFFFRVKMNKLK